MSMAKAAIEIRADDKASSALNRLKGSVGGLQGKFMGAAFAAQRFMAVMAGGTAVGMLVKKASDLEETMNKFNVVFGKNASIAAAWSDTLAAKIGRSKEEVRRFVSESQDLFVPLGFDDKSAYELSKTLTELGYDLASFNNLADADAIRDLQNALIGNGEAMKKYGVIINETAVKQELLNMGLNPAKVTNQQKVQARYNIILASTKVAQGDATRSAGAFANQAKRTQGVMSDLASTLGNALLPAATGVTVWLNQSIVKFEAWAAANQGLITQVARLAITFAGAGLAIFKVIPAVGSLSKALMLLMGNPIVAVVAGLASLVGYLVYTSAEGGNFGEKLAWINEKISSFWSAIVDVLAPALEYAQQAFMAFIQLIAPAWDAFTLLIKDVWRAMGIDVAGIGDWIFEKLTTAWAAIGPYIMPIVIWMRDGIVTAFRYISFAIQNWKAVLNYVMLAGAYYVVKFAMDTKHFFTVVIPAYLSWFKDHWKEVFITIGRLAMTVFKNIAHNVGEVWKKIKSVFGGEDHEISWRGLTEGFESAIKELPVIAQRVAGPMEANLANALNAAGNELNAKFEEHKEKFNNDMKTIEKARLDKNKPAPTGTATSSGTGPDKGNDWQQEHKGKEDPNAGGGKKDSGGTVGLQDLAKRIQEAAAKDPVLVVQKEQLKTQKETKEAQAKANEARKKEAEDRKAAEAKAQATREEQLKVAKTLADQASRAGGAPARYGA